MSGPDAAPGNEPTGEHEASRSLRLAADALTAHGFDVLVPGEQRPCQLFLTNVRGALCALDLSHDGTMAWSYQPFHGTPVESMAVARTVMTVLGASDSGLLATSCPGLALKSVVGRMLATCGLNVRLRILYRDDVNYEIHAGIEVTNPAQPARGSVQVGDDAAIRWKCAVGTSATSDTGLLLTDFVQVIAQVSCPRI